jgi:hypothetical protein
MAFMAALLMVCLCQASAVPAKIEKQEVASGNVGNISDRLVNEVPVMIRIGKEELTFKKEGGKFVARHGDFEAIVTVESLTVVAGKRWTTTIHNKGDTPLKNLAVFPLYQVFELYDIQADRPTVRYFNGSNYYDGKYPRGILRRTGRKGSSRSCLEEISL